MRAAHITLGAATLLSLAATCAYASDPSLDSSRIAPVYTSLQRNAWYLPTADGVTRLYVTEIGRGPRVVFLHGGPGNDFQYILDALLPHLDRHHFILFDQRGSLLSPVAPDKLDRVTFTALVEDLETLRKSLGQESLSLFGHSFGTLLALGYYKAHPQRVERLVLTGAFPPRFSLKGLIANMRPRQRALRERSAISDVLARASLGGDPAALTARQRTERATIKGLAAINLIDLNRWREVVGGGVYYSEDMDDRIADTIPDVLDFTPTILSHPVPITIVQGDQDYVDPGAEGWTRLKAEHPDLPIILSIIPQASHAAWIDDPDRFAAALRIGLESDL